MTSGTLREVFLVFLKLGLTSFGGPIAHLAYFRREFVERRRWLDEDRFAQLLGLCQFLPGPASSQLGFGIGLLRGGWFGALAAFVGFTLPSALLLLAFALALPHLSGPLASAALQGLKLVACVVVADAVRSMFKTLCRTGPTRVLAVLAALLLLVLASATAQTLVIVLGALVGALCLNSGDAPNAPQIVLGHGRRTGVVLLILFAVLLLGLPWMASAQAPLWSMAEAFYRAGAMVFGGGHVVLPLLQESMVGPDGISAEQFLAGYGAAQAVPGPLFTFAAYLGAVLPTTVHPFVAAALGLLFIFLPGLLLIAAMLPFWQSLLGNAQARAALAGVNAVVVGVLAAALYDPILLTAIRGWQDAGIVIVGVGVLLRWKVSPLWVLSGCVGASLLLASV